MNDSQRFAQRRQDNRREERVDRQPYGSPCDICGQTTAIVAEVKDKLTGEADTQISICGDCAYRIMFLADRPA